MPRGEEREAERELDRLYGLPLTEFTAARDMLAKRLRGEGRRELADRVKSLRKPNVASWLANQVVRERQLDVQRLLKAGESLSKAQSKAAGGASAEAFVDARREEQRALERLAQAAREIAGQEGVGASAVERATRTMRAASLTEEGRELLKPGRLTEDVEPPGFEALAGLAEVGGGDHSRQAPSRPRDGREERQQALRGAQERVRQLRTDERELAQRANAAERHAARAEKEAAKRRKEAEAAHAKAASAAEAVAAAEKDLEQLRAR
jgi:hypothetical protein